MHQADAFPLSIEFFPPKTSEDVEKLRAPRQHFYAIKPSFAQ